MRFELERASLPACLPACVRGMDGWMDRGDGQRKRGRGGVERKGKERTGERVLDRRIIAI